MVCCLHDCVDNFDSSLCVCVHMHKYMLDGGAMFISACKCIYFHLLVLNNIMHVHTNGVLLPRTRSRIESAIDCCFISAEAPTGWHTLRRQKHAFLGNWQGKARAPAAVPAAAPSAAPARRSSARLQCRSLRRGVGRANSTACRLPRAGQDGTVHGCFHCC